MLPLARDAVAAWSRVVMRAVPIHRWRRQPRHWLARVTQGQPPSLRPENFYSLASGSPAWCFINHALTILPSALLFVDVDKNYAQHEPLQIALLHSAP